MAALGVLLAGPGRSRGEGQVGENLERGGGRPKKAPGTLARLYVYIMHIYVYMYILASAAASDCRTRATRPIPPPCGQPLAAAHRHVEELPACRELYRKKEPITTYREV